MPGPAIREFLLAALIAATFGHAALAQDNPKQDSMKIAIGQRGGWEQSVSELGQNKGIFKKHGLVLDLFYTQGSAETLQSVISNSVDIGIGLGTHSMLSAFLKGAPIRGIGGSFTSADEQYYYVPADSPIKSMKDAGGKSISISTNGSASNMFALHLAEHFGVNLKPQPAGNYTSNLTQVMTKQLDIGFSAAPYNLNYVDEGKIRIIARGSDVPSLKGQTVRVLIANANMLAQRKEAVAHFIAAYREAVDWMYASPEAVAMFAKKTGVAEDLVRKSMQEFQPKDSLQTDQMADLDGAVRDAVKLKFLDAPLTKEQLAELIQIPPRAK
jgi:NitT/TauT family transport system substrate-binding protein